MTQTYLPLLLVALTALVSPWVSIRAFRGMLPAIVIEIAIGYLIGPHGFHVITSTQTIDFLANFAFSYLMFLAGLELDFDLLFDRGSSREKPAWLLGLLFFAMTLVISLAVSYMLQALHVIHNVPVVTLLLSTTSTGIVTPALKESGWISSPFGQRTLVFALLADMLTLVIFSAYVAFHSTGNALSFLLVMVLIACFVFLYRSLKMVRRLPFLRIVETATSEIGLRASIALILVFVVLSSTLGVQTIIGAFLAGAIVSLLDHRHSVLSSKLNAVGYGFLLPIFFVHVGMGFSFGTLGSGVGFYAGLIICLIAMYLNKIVPGLFFYRSFSMTKRISGGVLLGARLSLVIAASQISVQAHLISEGMANGLTLVAIVTSFLSPATFTRMMKNVTPPVSRTNTQPTIVIDRGTLPEGWDMAQIEVVKRDVFERRMRNLPLPDDILFVSLLRGDERIVPRGHTRLQQYDTIQLMGHPHAIEEVRKIVGP